MRNLLAVALLVASFDARAAITGRVLNEDGSPAANARVRAFRIESSDEWRARVLSESPDPTAIAAAQTGADGTFSIRTDPFVTLLVEKEGRAQILEAADGESRTIVLGTAVRQGRVRAQGKPVAGALLVFDRVFVTRTGEDGTFRVPESVTRTGPPFVYAPGYAVGTPPRAWRRRARELEDLELVRGVPIRGQVVAADGTTPAGGATVSVDGLPLTRSNADGTFLVEHAPKSWKVLAARDGNRIGIAVPGKTNAYLLKLRPGATVTGTVRSATDETPLGGVRVFFAGPYSSQSSAVSGAKGTFTMTALPPGMYRIHAFRPRFTGGMAREVRLTEGAKLQRAMLLHPSPVVSGVVVDEEKKPVSGVAIEALLENTRTAPDGTFDVAVSPNSPMRILVRKEGYAPVAAGPFALGEGERKRDVRIVLSKGIAFRLRLVDRSGAAVAGEPVSIGFAPDDDETLRTQSWICPPMGDCATDERGIYEMNLAPGAYFFMTGGEGSALHQQRHTVSEESPSLTLTVERGAIVRGKVVAPEGGTLPDSGLFVSSRTEQFYGRSMGVPVEADGTFVIPAAPPGPLTLFVQYGGRGPSSGGPESEITAPADDVVLVAPKLTRVEGRVVDRETRQPVPDFSIVQRRNRGLGWSSGGPQSFHSEEGTFVLDDVADGSNDLIVTAPGYAPATLSNVTAEGRTEPLVAQLERGAAVTGRVTHGGKGVADANVTAGAAGTMRNPGLSARTDAEGEFAFDGLAPGEYQFQVSRQGLPPARKSVEVTAGRDVRVEIDVAVGATVTGRVIDESGSPVARARVSSRLPGYGSVAPALTDAGGSFTLEGLTGEGLTITAEKAGFIAGVAENVNPAAGVPITLTLRRGGTISGRVRGLSDAELMMTRVIVFGSGVRSSTRPDPSGNFTLSGVADGRLNVVASVDGRGGPERSVQEQIEVTNGGAPPIDLDFGTAFVVSGRVTRSGVPVPTAVVRFQHGRGGRGMRGETNSQGVYELRVSETGEYRVFVETGPSGSIESGVVNVTGPMTHDIDLGGASLRGRVVDSATSQPVSGVQIQADAVDARGMLHATSDGDGRFSFDVIAPGRYQIRATGQRYATTVQQVDVREAGNPEIEVRIREGERATLNVVDAGTGRPMEMVAITVTDGTKRVVNTGQPFREEDGSFRVWLEPGRYTARVWAQGYVAATAQLTVPGPEITIAMSRAGRIVLQGSHEGAVRVRLVDLASGKTVMQTGIPPGVFENVVPGSYKLELLDANHAVVGTFPVAVAPGQTSTVGGQTSR